MTFNGTHIQTINDKEKHVDINTDHVVDILKNSLYGPYSICRSKFDVGHLIKYERRVNSIIL